MMRQKYHQSIHKPQQSVQLSKFNPFSKPNPIRIKSKFHSSQNKMNKQKIKSQSTQSHSSHNPQSLLYRRNYLESPIFYQDNYISQHTSLLRGKKHTIDSLSNQNFDYRRRLRQHIQQQHCPADPYLQVVKQKLIYMNNDSRSQFKNVMRTSNINKVLSNMHKMEDRNRYHSISGNQHNRNLHYEYRNGYRLQKQNPFMRKNLLTSTTQHSYAGIQSSSVLYNGSSYLAQSKVSNTNNYSYLYNDNYIENNNSYFFKKSSNTMNESQYASGNNQQIPTFSTIHTNPLHKRQSSFTCYQNNIKKSFSGTGGYQNYPIFQNNSFCINQQVSLSNQQHYHNLQNKLSPKSIPNYNPHKRIHTFSDFIKQNENDYKIQLRNQINYKNNNTNTNAIEQKAPKQIKIKGKVFYLNKVQPITY